MLAPRLGDVWLADLDPVRGHEQGGKRPVLIISADIYNAGPAGLVVSIPLTTKDRGIPLHVTLTPPQGGLKVKSVVLCDAIRSLSKDRLIEKWGVVSNNSLILIQERLKTLLDL